MESSAATEASPGTVAASLVDPMQLVEQPQDDSKNETVPLELYNRLKRKYHDLLAVASETSVELHSTKLTVRRLTQEKMFLLDKLIEMEEVDSGPSRPAKRTKLASVPPEDLPSVETNRNRNDNIDLDALPGLETTPRSQAASSTASAGAEPENLCAGFIGEGRPCRSKALPSSAYCWRHSPLDANSGMMYCSHMKKGKRCTNPIPISTEDKLCTVHRRKLAAATKPPAPSPAAEPIVTVE